MNLLRHLLLAAAFATSVLAQPFGLSNRVANNTLAFPQIAPAQRFTSTNAFVTNGGGGLTFSAPTVIASARGETNRLFVLERAGRIQMVTNLGGTNPVRSQMIDFSRGVTQGGENGALGLALHPNFTNNGYLFVYRSQLVTNGPTVTTNQRLARFQATGPTFSVANTNTEAVLFDQMDPAGNHNGGDLHFGPDGYLYVSLGDGGGQNDVFNNTQTLRKGFHAGVLRLDADKLPGSLPPNLPSAISDLTIYTNYYAIPPGNFWVSNTFVHETNRSAAFDGNVRTEYYAVGLRNPWRFSFDPATGLLWLGDVGGGAREEVTLITNGGNYGWAYREGFIVGPKAAQTNLWHTNTTPSPWATTFTSLNPIFDYNHGTAATNVGNSITGGVVYRGTNLPGLDGAYVFCDYVSGNFWSLNYTNGAVSNFQTLFQDTSIVAFGTNPLNGDVLFCDYSVNQVRRLITNANFGGTSAPLLLSQTGAFTNLTTLAVAPGIVPYTINVPFWSDNAIKTRWFSVPDTSLDIAWDATNHWQFPTGTVWIKHFDLVTNFITSAQRRLETRFLVRNPDGVYGLVYRWNSTTNAVLVDDFGLTEPFIITNADASIRTQQWRYPSRAECLACHTAVGGHALGFNTPQMNCNFTYTNFTGVSDNQLRALNNAGYFTPPVSNLAVCAVLAHATNTAWSLEYRVRSYLHANCSQCHQPGGSALGSWDARFTTPLSLAGIVNGAVNNTLGNPNARVIVPGATNHSMLHTRITNLAALRMPPVGSSLVDTNNRDLLIVWINSVALTGYQTFSQWQVTHFGSTNAPTALANADGDGDGVSNYLEWLLGTTPTNAVSDWRVNIQMAGSNAQLRFPQIANRGFEVQWRTNLNTNSPWTVLNVLSNAPFISAGSFTNIVTDPGGSGTNKTYRVRVFEP